MDWENAEQVLPKLKIPILAFGVGAQAPKEGKLQLSEQSKRIWKHHRRQVGLARRARHLYR